jgi:folate-dependent phosphoribosylglycinamide formyltransferase PurN
MKGRGLVLLAGEGESTRILANFLLARFPVEAILVERRVSRIAFLKRRVKSLGWGHVAGQIAFQCAVAPFLGRSARSRAEAIKRSAGMDASALDESLITRVDSANSEAARAKLAALAPSVIVINGTRILSARTLGCVDSVFVNMHAGITPLFRGVHGGYWALATGRPEECGITVHRVDPGIDTGTIWAQSRISPDPDDNFTTYPLLQLGEGMRLLEKLLPDLLAGRIPAPIPQPRGESRLWSHPTAWEYLSKRIRMGVR